MDRLRRDAPEYRENARHLGDWDELRSVIDKLPVVPRATLAHFYGRHEGRKHPTSHCLVCVGSALAAAEGGEE